MSSTAVLTAVIVTKRSTSGPASCTPRGNAKGQENNTLLTDVPELVGLQHGMETDGRAPPGMEAATENLQQVNDDAGQGQEELPDKEAVNVDQGADDGAMDLDADQDAQGGASAEGE